MTQLSELQRDAQALREDLITGAVVDRVGALERYSWETHYLDAVLAELAKEAESNAGFTGDAYVPITPEVLAPLLPGDLGSGLTVEDVVAVTGRSTEEVKDAIRRISTPTPSAREAAERLGVMTPESVKAELVKQYEEFFVERDPDVEVVVDGMDVKATATVPIFGDITVVSPPPFPDIGCERECGFERRGVGLKCVEGTACGAYYHPGDKHHAELEAFHVAMTGTPAPGTWHETAVILRWRDGALAGGGDRCSPGTIGELVAELDRYIGASAMGSYGGGLAGLRLPLGPAVLDLDEAPGDEIPEANGRVDRLAVDLYMAAMAKAGSEGQRPDSVGVALACMVGLAEELLELREVVIDVPQEVKPIAALFHAHRRELVEALGLNDADAIYLWEDLLASVRSLASIADAAVAGLDKPEGEFFGPWALRIAEARVGRLRDYEAQLERAFGGDRWRTYADPIRAMADAEPGLVARMMSGAMERAVADRITPANLELLAQEMAPPEPQGWREGFLAAAEIFGREFLDLAKASDRAAEQWSVAQASVTDFQLRLDDARAGLGSMMERANELELLVAGQARAGWRVGDRYLSRNGVGVVVDVVDAESLYGCEGADRFVYEYGPDDACCSPLSELRSLRASPIIRTMAAKWSARAMDFAGTREAGLARWVSDRAEAGADLLAESLAISPAKVAELLGQASAKGAKVDQS